MDKNKQIIIGSDHAAFELKEKIKDLLTGLGYEVEDVGTHSTVSVNYPDFGKKVARAVSDGTFERGILLCGTGIGMTMQANRFKGVRAALCADILSARLSRQHNDANILVMGGRMVGDILAFEVVREWLATPFDGGRHLDRIRSLDDLG
ncbi:MAG TPA: ribose 5-phosphate isomerase B [Desulfobacter sp.]|nr:ribose 5-phosphate isomerase B [Desulfobacter sp.]